MRKRCLPSKKEVEDAIQPWIHQKAGKQSADRNGIDGAIDSSISDRKRSEASDCEEAWREIVLHCLSYGTDYNRVYRHNNSSSNSNGNGNDDGGDKIRTLEERCSETTAFLLDCMSRFDASRLSRDDLDDNAKASDISNSNADVSGVGGDVTPESVLVDAIWLVGNMLEPSSASSASNAASATSANAANAATKLNDAVEQKRSESYKALSKILHGLAYGPPPSDASVSQNSSDHDPNHTGNKNNGNSNNNKNITLLNPKQLFKAIEPSLLASAGILKEKSLFFKKFRKLNTDMHYRQKKVNLMQEESEGYAKLLTFLISLPGFHHDDTDVDTTNDDHNHKHIDVRTKILHNQKGVQQATQRVRELIGAFDLDPNRVLDLTLDALESEIHSFLSSPPASNPTTSASSQQNQTWVDRLHNAPNHASTVQMLLAIVAMFRIDSVSHLMGFKFASYYNDDTSTIINSANSNSNADQGSSETNSASGSKDGKLGNKVANKKQSSASSSPPQPPLPQHPNVNKDKTIPKSLYVTCAILAAHDILSLSVLKPHLHPGMEPLLQMNEKWRKEYSQRIRKIGIVSLNSTKSATSAGESKEKKDGGGGDESGNKDELNQSEEETSRQLLERHVLLQLFRTLLQVGVRWDVATLLFSSQDATRTSTDNENNSTSANDKCDTKCLEEEAAKKKKVEETISSCCAIYPLLGETLCQYTLYILKGLYSVKVKEVGPQICSSPSSSNAKNITKNRSSTTTTTGSSISVKTASLENAIQGEEDNFFSLLPSFRGWNEWHHDLQDPDSQKQHHSHSLSSPVLVLSNVSKALSGPISVIASAGCVASNPIFYCRLCRLFRALLLDQIRQEEDDNTDNNNRKSTVTTIDETTYQILKSFLVPSLSLFPYNPSISSELWSVLTLLPYQIRYVLYEHWKQNGLEKAALRSTMQPPKPLHQIESEVNTGVSTRYLLKRMSKDNIRDMGRQVSKVSHNNPLVVFTTILNQIESYDNLILLMVETFKFVTVLSLDVMGYCLLTSLGGGNSFGGRSKLKEDGVNPAQWLSSLETFTGAFYKKFPEVELDGILSYIMKRLQGGQVLELGVLQTLLKMAGGYGFADPGSVASLSQVQLDGRCGSQLLKRETADFGIVEKVNNKSSRRLRSVLQDNGRGAVFLILLSQIRTRIVYEASKGKTKQIKLIGNLYDNCQKTLCLMLSFLTDYTEEQEHEAKSNGEDGLISKYGASLPSLGDLHDVYGVETAVAWMLYRPLIRNSLFAEEKTDKTTYLKTPQTMKDRYSSMLPEESWIYISPVLFEKFYLYALYDMHCPEERYKNEISRLKKEVDRLTQLQKGGSAAKGTMASLAAAAAAAGATEREIRKATAFTKSHEEELERARQNSAVLSSDMAKQIKHCDIIRNDVQSHKESLFFKSPRDDSTCATAKMFLTHCVYPRCLLSPEDAMYCAKFVFLLHQIETPGFYTLQYFDVFVNAIVGCLYCVTEDEAGCLGILLEETWKIINNWRYDEKFYEKDVTGKPGATWIMNADVDGSSMSEIKTKKLSHGEYINLYNRWHETLVISLIGCLKSSEYMHSRTALILLTRIVRVFPTKSNMGEKILESLSPLQGDENPMQDIRAMAQAYSSQILKARDDGVWKEEDRAATKARLEREEKLKKERQKNVAKNLEDMQRDNEQIARDIGGGRPKNWGRDERGTGQRLRGSPPPTTGHPAVQSSSAQSGERPGSAGARGHTMSDLRDHTRDNRLGDRRSMSDREQHGLKDRWERDKGGKEEKGRDLIKSNQGIDRERGEIRGNRGTDNRSALGIDVRSRSGMAPGGPDQGKGLEGRWERNGNLGPGNQEEGRGFKRARSPDRSGATSERGRGGDVGRDGKRMKSQPPQNLERGGVGQPSSAGPRRSNSPGRRQSQHQSGRSDRRSRR